MQDGYWAGRGLSLQTVPARGALPANTLCALRYGDVAGDADPRCVCLPLPVLRPVVEMDCWVSPRSVHCDCVDDIVSSEDGHTLFLHGFLPDSTLEAMEDAVQGLYERLLQCAAHAGFEYPLRLWNYLSAINTGDGDTERYRRFCAGRYRALDRRLASKQLLPAASCVGSPSGSGLHVFGFFTREPGLQVENPRQVSAFHYPRAYGKRSPSFSRAILAPWVDNPRLLISGTASIVGHATAHVGDPEAQLRQTLENLDALRAAAVRNHLHGRDKEARRPVMAVVYVRYREDVPRLMPMLRRHFDQIPLRVLQGDICRRDLLVEIEAVHAWPRVVA